MISSGKLTNSNHDIVNSHIPEHNETTVLHKPEARITRELLLHLLVAVEHANNLKSYVEQNSDISFVTNEIFSKLVNLVHCQLNASMIFLNELDIIQATDKVDLPKGDLETTNVDFSYCRDGISPSKNFLPAEDPIVEDDVLDDIAVGNSSSHESEAEYENDNMDSLKNPSTSMHISVLKELKNAISHRRIIMQEREECALRRRLQIDRPYDEKPNLSTNDNINLSSEMELQSQFSLSSTPYATNQNNFVTMNEKLSNFFPTSSSYNSTYKVNKQYYSTDRNLQSNVLKRNTIFHYLSSSIHHKNDKNAKYTNSFILNNDLLSTKLSNNSLLQQSTLTTILMNQRKLLGFTKEDYFTGIGLGESCIEISQETNSPTS
ncbi:hypothetical protein MN116_007455 [Schistosoma mekongi]|uniref:Uncharacterized protein n=1 Tax=Schistosoma mekongi TaxID=38744 RepID=A0AAE1Z9A8_SCHME|nr:hypothetical protein MN116_007455 [Schistosoma mekongi]